MNIQLSVYYSIEDEVQEPIQVDLDDESIKYLLMHILRESRGRQAELEDFVIEKVCLD